MALTKVNRGGLNTGISDSSNATFLTVDTSEQAVIKSEGGSATTSVQQGLCKVWAAYPGTAASIHDSFNVASLTDTDTGISQMNFTNNMANSSLSITTTNQLTGSSGSSLFYGNVFGYATTHCGSSHFENGSFTDPTRYHAQIAGDLA